MYRYRSISFNTYCIQLFILIFGIFFISSLMVERNAHRYIGPLLHLDKGTHYNDHGMLGPCWTPLFEVGIDLLPVLDQQFEFFDPNKIWSLRLRQMQGHPPSAYLHIVIGVTHHDLMSDDQLMTGPSPGPHPQPPTGPNPDVEGSCPCCAGLASLARVPNPDRREESHVGATLALARFQAKLVLGLAAANVKIRGRILFAVSGCETILFST